MADGEMDRWTSTTYDWYAAVGELYPMWVQHRSSSTHRYCVRAWVHNMGLVLRGKYIGAKQREAIWSSYIRAMVTHESAVRAAYRLGGPTSAIEVAGQVAFG